MTDQSFLDGVADALAALPAVEAVTLGGSRALGVHRPESDWDLGVYYRGHFEPQYLRQLGWSGEVSELGGWGGGVFNGGAWLRIDGRSVDVHYRDLDVVEEQLARATRGEFHIEPLMFHLAGIPSYLVVGELAINRVLRGDLPAPEYPAALRRSAPPIWSDRAEMNLHYAKDAHAPSGRTAQVAGLIAVAATQYAHAILAARGEWTTNEKRILDRAGLGATNEVVSAMTGDPEVLDRSIAAVRDIGRRVLEGT